MGSGLLNHERSENYEFAIANAYIYHKKRPISACEVVAKVH
jgi:hypothetical protein